ncbi:MAG: Hydroxypyruvate isomerase [Verrucomicrobia subdivision 3 bacterium]|nr:Hydroxypyruvate isomerase [Limisphaerales bacterium]MCS1417688.1 Hydroxypyruvate isomerase [Limisphaerales bacterium]
MASQNPISRRRFITQTTGAFASARIASTSKAAVPDIPVIKHGRIRQSIMGWCFNPMPVMELARHCKAIGLVAMEGVGIKFYPQIRELGLDISLVGSHGFATGPVSIANHDYCRQILLERIDLAASIGANNVITFTGMSEPGISPEQGTKNCVSLWKSVMRHAESKNVHLSLEHLNSRDDSHPMKGHPGYFGDDVDFCVDLIKRVDSPNMKLLFDIYHVQVMNGDVIRRIRQYQDVIGHYHTAGNPGRGELDEDQEINYPAILRAILRTGYMGFVAQEFIPTWDDKIGALRHAAALCDVTI